MTTATIDEQKNTVEQDQAINGDRPTQDAAQNDRTLAPAAIEARQGACIVSFTLDIDGPGAAPTYLQLEFACERPARDEEAIAADRARLGVDAIVPWFKVNVSVPNNVTPQRLFIDAETDLAFDVGMFPEDAPMSDKNQFACVANISITADEEAQTYSTTVRVTSPDAEEAPIVSMTGAQSDAFVALRLL